MVAIAFIVHALAVLVGMGSASFYIAAFFYPEVSRPRDAIWSGLGLFYAALLWIGAAQMTLALLTGQLIAIVLLGVLGWQTLSIRREKTPVYQQTPVVITPEVAGNWAKNKINQLRIAPTEPVPLKLEKRSLDEFSDERLGLPIDPRRRPVAEYEFVEDGLWEPTADAEQLSLSLNEESIAEEAAVGGTAPWAIADVISVDMPEETEDGTDSGIETAALESEPLEAASEPELSDVEAPVVAPSDKAEATVASNVEASNVEAPNVEVSDAEAFDRDESALEDAVSEATDRETADREKTPKLSERVVAIAVDEANVGVDRISDSETDDWGDRDWIDADLSEEKPEKKEVRSPASSSASPSVARSKEKPSLMAMPVIFLGWVKDVVTDLTKPKPTKPVIEIPRRNPSIARSPATPSATTPSATTQRDPAQADTAGTSASQSPTVQQSPANTYSDKRWDNDPISVKQRTIKQETKQETKQEPIEESNWDD